MASQSGKLIPESGINQYTGINAHLNDYLQTRPFRWEAFHDRHIGSIQDALNDKLIPIGYMAESEPGLQIRHSLNDPRWRIPDSDGTIFDVEGDGVPTQRPPASSRTGTAIRERTIPESLGKTREEYLAALVIYERRTINDDNRVPVAWVELLSPVNKPRAHDFTPDEAGNLPEYQDRDWHKYDEKRTQLLHSGIVLMEIDYLNRTLPMPDLTPYEPIGDGKDSPLHPREGTGDAPEPHPYYINVNDPHYTTPDTELGLTTTYFFDADQPIPEVTLPLSHSDHIDISLQDAYNQTVALPHNREKIDYAQKPIFFDHYRTDDQDRIAARTITILEAAQKGQLPEDQEEPLPLSCPVEGARLKLDEALAHYAQRENGQDLEI